MKRLLTAVTVALTAVTSACGGNGGTTSGVASIDGRAASARSGGDEKAADHEAAALAFARCMRKNGVNVPDPGGDGMVLVAPAPGGGGPVDAVDQDFARAEKACEKERRALEGTVSGPSAADQDKFYEMARCMRRHGVDMPDPAPGGGNKVVIGIERADLDNPEFKAAHETCRKEAGLPGPGPGGGGPGGATPVSP